MASSNELRNIALGMSLPVERGAQLSNSKKKTLVRKDQRVMAGNEIVADRFQMHNCPRCNRSNIGHYVIKCICVWCGYRVRGVPENGNDV